MKMKEPDPSQIFLLFTDRKRGNGHKLRNMKFHLSKSTVSTIKHCPKVVESPSVQILKIQLDTVLGNLR